ncbi:MAG: ATP-binding cassette domain-containing protein [Planctomycetes bacterium]|nr:ATP-binding cassette domain-containing protein [Planctomycetota bacterium]
MSEAGTGRISTRGLTRRFGAKLALAPTDLELEPGCVTGLLGPNGSGKSTLMRMLIGLVPPSGGSASVDGVALSGDGTAIRERCTYAPGEIALYGELDGAEHLDWFLRGRTPAARRRAREIATSFELPLDKRVHTYSHGMKRQLMFSAAMAPDVRVRILDEPSEGLDPNKRSTMIQRIQDDVARGTTILLSSHHLGEVDRVCDTFVFLSAGRTVAIERAADIARRATRLVRLEFANANALAEPLPTLAHAQLTLRGATLLAELRCDDPRAFLAEWAARRDLPAPRSIEYGKTSLGDLYRSLYGVEEAC